MAANSMDRILCREANIFTAGDNMYFMELEG